MDSTNCARAVARAVAFAIAAGAAANAAAQNAPASQGPVLEEVTITAQKREEKLQEVPLSVTAFSAAELENRHIEGLAGLNSIAPNVTFRQNPGARLIATFGIRGSVQGQPAIWIDPPVGVYLDGIYLGKTQGSVFDVVDIERVEVLRGPQGTLFGRNTEGGAVNFVTRKPSGEFKGNVGVEFGNYGRKTGRISMDLPKFGIASVSLAARREKADGWAKNLTGPDQGSIDSKGFRGTVKLDFNDNLNAIYAFDATNVDQVPTPSSLIALRGWGGTFPSIFNNPQSPVTAQLGTRIEAAIAPYVVTKRPDTVSTNLVPGQPGIYERLSSNAHSLVLDWSVNDHNELKYIFATRYFHYEDSQDIDGTPLASVAIIPGVFNWGLSANFNRRTHYRQDSHELQWVADAGPVKWVVGAYYFRDLGQTNGAQAFTLFGNPPQRSDYGANTEAYAAFGQADWNFADRWTATVGLRYTEESRDGFTHRYTTNGFDGAFLSDARLNASGAATGLLPYTAYKKTFTGTQPMAALSFKLNPDINLYARVAKGFKSGGFSSEVADPRVNTPFAPQTSVSKEIGIKSELFGGRARVNLAYFNNKITDQHITQLLPGTTQSLVTNAGESTYQGVELEAQVAITEGWRVGLNYGYLDPKFDKYIDNAFTAGRPLIDTASNRMPAYAPKNTISANLDGRLLKTSFGALRLLLDYSSTSKVYLYAVNKSLSAPNAGGSYVQDIDFVPANKNLNARLLMSDVPVGGGSADFSIYVKNVTDEDKQVQGIDFSMFMNGAWQEPRTYMFTANFKW